MSAFPVRPWEGPRPRIRTVKITEEWFADIFTEGREWTTFRCKRGLPKGARLVDVTHLRLEGLVLVSFEHESFEPGDHGFTPSFEKRFRPEESA